VSGFLYPVVKTDKAKQARAARLWAIMTRDRDKARLREIWSAILKAEAIERLPHEQKITATPHIRGAGHAAKKAGF